MEKNFPITGFGTAAVHSGHEQDPNYSLYGGTEELITNLLPPLGISAIITDLRDLNIAEEAMKKDKAIKMLYLETPANPTIQCVDIEELSKLAKQYGMLVACDNTFA